jgi:predicted phage tail component-like protein
MIIIKQDGTIIDVADYNLKCSKYNIPSPSLTHYTDTVEGRDGDVFLGSSNYQNREISVEMVYQSADINDFYSLKSDFNRLFSTRESFYVVFDREPDRRWKVRLKTPFNVNIFSGRKGTFTIQFIAESPFSESLDSTLNMSIAQISGTKEIKYTQSTSTFEILNDGDMTIDPRIVPLVIQFKGTSTNLQISNLTTGEICSYTGTSQAGDTIEINNIRSLKNGLSIFLNTNRKLITLVPGWNEFQISGASGTFEVLFDFRYYMM